MSNLKEQAGNCPKCGDSNLVYGVMQIEDGQLMYPYTCDSCGFKGEEWYNLTFDCHADEFGEGV